MKIARVVGARPQFMQVPVLKAAFLNEGWQHVLIHTGQHYDHSLSQGQFDDLGLGEPDYNLQVGSGRAGASTAQMVEKIENLLLETRPDLVVVDGDTNSTLATAIAVAKLPIPLVHIEAGLRDKQKGRPEEINRTLTDHSADLNCAPIQRALENLRKENLGDNSVFTGDLLLDCYCYYKEKAQREVLAQHGLQSGKYNLMTLHRPENTDIQNYDRFCSIMKAVSSSAYPVIWPVHPRSRPIIRRYLDDGHSLGVIKLIEPQTYLPMLGLLLECDMVLTDSGGLPREATWSGKRCVILTRDAIWHDLLDGGLAQLGATDQASVEQAMEAARPHDGSMAKKIFGDGLACSAIVTSIKSRLYDAGAGTMVSDRTKFMLAH